LNAGTDERAKAAGAGAAVDSRHPSVPRQCCRVVSGPTTARATCPSIACSAMGFGATPHRTETSARQASSVPSRLGDCPHTAGRLITRLDPVRVAVSFADSRDAFAIATATLRRQKQRIAVSHLGLAPHGVCGGGRSATTHSPRRSRVWDGSSPGLLQSISGDTFALSPERLRQRLRDHSRVIMGTSTNMASNMASNMAFVMVRRHLQDIDSELTSGLGP
jgi:hypothetical protein